jgi:hypothetical protein
VSEEAVVLKLRAFGVLPRLTSMDTHKIDPPSTPAPVVQYVPIVTTPYVAPVLKELGSPELDAELDAILAGVVL